MVKKHCHSLELVLSGVKQHHVLALEIWGENAVADGVDDFSAAPEAAAVEFVAWCGGAAYGGAVSVYKFALAFAFKYVAAQEPRLEILQSQFLAGLAPQGAEGVLAIVNVAADRGVPFAGLDILPQRASLQVQSSFGVEHVEVDYRMQQSGAAVTLAAGGRAYDVALLIYQRKNLVAVVFIHSCV